MFNEKKSFVVIAILIFAMSLTLSTIDTLINAISSLIIVDGYQLLKIKAKHLSGGQKKKLSIARALIDDCRILFMDEGKVVETSSPDEFFANAREERSRRFLNQVM